MYTISLVERDWKIIIKYRGFARTELYAFVKCSFKMSLGLNHLPSCRIYGLEDRISIGSDNGLSPSRRQAII